MPYQVGSMYSGKLGSILWVIGDAASLGTLAAAWGGFIPPLISLVVLIYYMIQIRESTTIQSMLRRWRLRKLVRLRATAVKYELFLQQRNTDLVGLAAANKVHLAAESAAAESTRAALQAEVNKETIDVETATNQLHQDAIRAMKP